MLMFHTYRTGTDEEGGDSLFKPPSGRWRPKKPNLSSPPTEPVVLSGGEPLGPVRPSVGLSGVHRHVSAAFHISAGGESGRASNVPEPPLPPPPPSSRGLGNTLGITQSQNHRNVFITLRGFRNRLLHLYLQYRTSVPGAETLQ